jgi:hypothetical protein
MTRAHASFQESQTAIHSENIHFVLNIFPYNARNKLLEKYIGILGHVNRCSFMVLVAFLLVHYCAERTLRCFLVASKLSLSQHDIFTDIYASQDPYYDNGACPFYTY